LELFYKHVAWGGRRIGRSTEKLSWESICQIFPKGQHIGRVKGAAPEAAVAGWMTGRLWTIGWVEIPRADAAKGRWSVTSCLACTQHEFEFDIQVSVVHFILHLIIWLNVRVETLVADLCLLALSELSDLSDMSQLSELSELSENWRQGVMISVATVQGWRWFRRRKAWCELKSKMKLNNQDSVVIQSVTQIQFVTWPVVRDETLIDELVWIVRSVKVVRIVRSVRVVLSELELSELSELLPLERFSWSVFIDRETSFSDEFLSKGVKSIRQLRRHIGIILQTCRLRWQADWKVDWETQLRKYLSDFFLKPSYGTELIYWLRN